MDLRELARRRLPSPIFHFMDGAAETEATARRNIDAFDDVRLVPRCLIDVGSIKTQVSVLGRKVAWPVLCSPTGASRLFDPEGELAVARAAEAADILYCVSTSSNFSLEHVARASASPKVFQLYVQEDRDATLALIERAKHANYSALCLTVDVAMAGKRERDLRLGFGLQPTWSLRNILRFAPHPKWVLNRVGRNAIVLANATDSNAARDAVGKWSRPSPSVTWSDVREFVDLWGGVFALKGIMSADDARRAVDFGVNAVIVSNHGGRQLDGAVAPLDVLPEIVRAVGDRIEVILDGGVRRGVHVLKALALGARACSIGRPYLYGLGAAGEAGVSKALAILRAEFELAMRLSGCPSLESIDTTLVRRCHVRS